MTAVPHPWRLPCRARLKRVWAGVLLLAALVPAPSVAQAGKLPYTFSFPAPIILKYEVEGVVRFGFTGSAELMWRHDGNSYNSSLAVRKFGINLRTWTSKGILTKEGLAPDRFLSKTGKEVSANFLREKGLVVFSEDSPQVPLETGAQDQLSVFLQLSSLLAGEQQKWTTGSTIAFQAIGDRYPENWVFNTAAPEKIKLPGGEITAIKLTREANADRDQKVEVWFAPSYGYLPVNIRISQPNGDFINMLWSESVKP